MQVTMTLEFPTSCCHFAGGSRKFAVFLKHDMSIMKQIV